MTRGGRLLALVGCVGLFGCSTAIDDDTPLRVVAILDAGDPITAPEIFERATGTRTFRSTEGASVTWTTGPDDRHDAEWATSDDRRTSFWRLDGTGNLVSTAVLDHEEHALTLFDPPLVLAAARLAPTTPLSSTCAMLIVDPGRPSRIKERGRGTQTITYVDDCLLDLPGGRIRARRVEVRFEADLRMADAVERTTLYVAETGGIIAEDRAEVVRVLGLVIKDRRRVLILEEEEEEEEEGS